MPSERINFNNLSFYNKQFYILSSGASGGTVVLLSHIGLYLLGEIINKLLFQPCDSGPGQQAAGGIVEIVRAAPHYRSRGGAVMIFVTDSRRRADLSCLMCPIDNSFLGGLYHLRRQRGVQPKTWLKLTSIYQNCHHVCCHIVASHHTLQLSVWWEWSLQNWLSSNTNPQR